VIADAIAAAGLPAGVFALVHGRREEVGAALVQHPETRAVGFTGSLRGGRALFDLAARRPVPIPVFAEMGSVNPVFLLPGAIAEAGAALATSLAGSVTLGVGQFCTNPGLVIVRQGPGLEEFLAALAGALEAAGEAPMLHQGIRRAYDARLDQVTAVPGVRVHYRGQPETPCGARAALLSTPATRFLAEPTLHEEVFGPSTLVVVGDSTEQLVAVAGALEGQLTATIHAGSADHETCARLIPLLEQRAGRLVFGGFPTGVEVSEAMVHGGPYPATTDSRTTSVGTGAIARFIRPVAYQNFPKALLPEELGDPGA
jgi:NADP-dependent aldehyde dehydrogenase